MIPLLGRSIGRAVLQKMYIESLEKRASSGDMTSMFALAIAYEEGRSTDIDLDKAIDWYEKAAELGDKYSQLALASLLGLEGDMAGSSKWLERAAEQNHCLAQARLGVFHEYGLGGKVDFDQAEYWYKRAAMQNDMESYFRLGLLYHKELCNPPDEGASIRCLRRASNMGHLVATAYLGEYYEQGRVVIRNYEKAVAYYRRSAKGGFAGAQFCLGQMIQNGLGVPRSEEEGAWWIGLAAEQGFTPAVYLMCLLSVEGKGMPVDLAEACKWLCIGSSLRSRLGPAMKNLVSVLEEMCEKKAEAYHWREGEKRANNWLDRFTQSNLHCYGFYSDR